MPKPVRKSGKGRPSRSKSGGVRGTGRRRRSRRPEGPNPDAEPFKDSARGIRLHKAMADVGVASRRACEQLIEDRRITVNNVLIDFSPAWIDPDQDIVRLDGNAVLSPRRRKTTHHYIMVNKPRGVICTNDDPEGRRSITDLVNLKARLFCVGRLDADSNGLVLLTDDGELAHILTHPSFEIPKTYDVTIKGRLTSEDVERLEGGIFLGDRKGGAMKTAAERVKVMRRDRERTKLLITLTEGRNREIRRMLARLNYPVKRLRRTAIGPLELQGVTSGNWRKLLTSELNALRTAARRAAKQVR